MTKQLGYKEIAPSYCCACQLVKFSDLAIQSMQDALKFLSVDEVGRPRRKRPTASILLSVIQFAQRVFDRSQYTRQLLEAVPMDGRFRLKVLSSFETLDRNIADFNASTPPAQLDKAIARVIDSLQTINRFSNDFIKSGKTDKVPVVRSGKGTTKCIRFLHLSDWHVGTEEERYLFPQVKQDLFDDLTDMIAHTGSIDVVFFTGDFVQSGKLEEYELLDRFFAPLCSLIASPGSRPLLFGVPGNHDLVRPMSKKHRPALDYLWEWHTHKTTREQFVKNPHAPTRRVVKEAFKNYVTWIEKQNLHNGSIKINKGLLPGDFSATAEIRGIKLGVVGLNSAFLQLTGKDYYQRLAVLPQQLQQACALEGPTSGAPQWVERHDVAILLTHHPVTWLSEGAEREFRSEIHIPGRFALHLCGHMHMPRVLIDSQNGERPTYTVQARSLFGLEHWEDPNGEHVSREHGYSIGEINLTNGEKKFRFYPRRRKPNGSRGIILDNVSFDIEKNSLCTRYYR